MGITAGGLDLAVPQVLRQCLEPMAGVQKSGGVDSGGSLGSLEGVLKLSRRRSKKPSFTRKRARLKQRKVFYLAVEGEVTEYQYFTYVETELGRARLQIRCVVKGGAPKNILKKLSLRLA